MTPGQRAWRKSTAAGHYLMRLITAKSASAGCRDYLISESLNVGSVEKEEVGDFKAARAGRAHY